MTPDPEGWGTPWMSEERQQIRSGMYYNTTPLINIYYLYEGRFGIGYYRENEAFFSNCRTYLAGIRTELYYDDASVINFYKNGSLIRSYSWRDLTGDERERRELFDEWILSLATAGTFWGQMHARRFDADNNILTVVTKGGQVLTFDITDGDTSATTNQANLDSVDMSFIIRLFG